MPDNWIGRIYLTDEEEILDDEGEKIHDLLECPSEGGSDITVDKTNYPVLHSKLPIKYFPYSPEVELPPYTYGMCYKDGLILTADWYGEVTEWTMDGVPTGEVFQLALVSSNNLRDITWDGTYLYSVQNNRVVRQHTTSGGSLDSFNISAYPSGMSWDEEEQLLIFVGANDPHIYRYAVGGGYSDKILLNLVVKNRLFSVDVKGGNYITGESSPQNTIKEWSKEGNFIKDLFEEVATFKRIVSVPESIYTVFKNGFENSRWVEFEEGSTLPKIDPPEGSPFPYKIIADKT